MPNASEQDIKKLKYSIIDFFAAQKAKDNPGFDEKAFREAVFNSGFTTFTNPKEIKGNLFAAIGFKDASTGRGLDVVIAKNLQRKYLFVQDNLRLSMSLLIQALKIHTAEELIAHLGTGSFDPIIIPSSDSGNGMQAILDRLAGIVRAVDIPSINCAGWTTLLTCYLKGERCLTSDLEKALLDKIHHALHNFTDEIDMPKALLDQLITVEDPCQKMAVSLAFWLEKALNGHLNNNPKAALMLFLQAALSLKLHGYGLAVDNLWQHMKPSTQIEGQGLCSLICEVLNSGPGAFDKLIPLLEAKALLILNTTGEKDAAFVPNLIMHDEKAALQLKMEGICLLLPFDCQRTMLNFRQQTLDTLPALAKLEAFIQVKSPYTKTAIPEKTLPTLVDMSSFSGLWGKVAAEWLLASEVQHRTAEGSQILEKIMPDLLCHAPDIDHRTRLVQSAENKVNTPQEGKLYRSLRMLLGNKDYAEVPLPLIWVMALAASEDPSRCLDAFNLWEKHSSTLNAKTKVPFTKMLIRKLPAVRLDLALKIMVADNTLSFPDNSILLSELQTAYDKNVLFQSAQNLTLFIEAAGKIPLQKVPKAILWTIDKCIKHKKYAKAMELAEASQLYPQFLELLKQGAPDKWDLIVRLGIPSRLPDAISLLCAWKPAPALEWKHLFDRIKNEGNKELCIKAWNDFHLCLDDPQLLQGTQAEIAEAWHAALKAIDRHHRPSSLEIFGKEITLLSIFANYPLKETACLLLYENLLYASSENTHDEHLRLLVQLRHASESDSKKGDWKTGDLKLAGLLSLSKSPSLQAKAFILFVKYSEDARAEQIILTVLQNPITNPHELVEALLSFFSRLPKQKCILALNILQAINICSVLNCTPSKSFDTLYVWHEKIHAANAATQALTLHILKHCFELTTPASDPYRLAVLASAFTDSLENINSLKNKPDLRNFLIKNYHTLVEVLQAQNRYDELFMLVSAAKRSNLNIPNTVEVYYMLITHSKKGDILLPEFLACLKYPLNIPAYWKIRPDLAITILKKALASKDNEIIHNAWDIIWTACVSKGLLETHSEQKLFWEFTLTEVYKTIFKAPIQILGNLPYFKELLAHQTKTTKLALLIAKAALSLDHLAKDQQQYFQTFLTAIRQIQRDYEEDSSIQLICWYNQLIAGMFAGDADEYQFAYLAILSLMVNGKEKAHSAKQHQIIDCLLFPLALSSSERVLKLFQEQKFITFIKTCGINFRFNNPQNLKILPDFINLICKSLILDDCIPIFEAVLSEPCDQLLEMLSLKIIALLQNNKLHQNERHILLTYLCKCLDIAKKEKFSFSATFYHATTTPPFLTQKNIIYDSIFSTIISHLISLNYACIGKKLNDLDTPEIIKFIDFCKHYLSLMIHFDKSAYECAFTCLIQLAIHNPTVFTSTFKAFLDKVDSRQIQLHYLMIEIMFKLKASKPTLFNWLDNFIKDGFQLILNLQPAPDERLEQLIHNYAFWQIFEGVDKLGNERIIDVQVSRDNSKTIVVEAFKKGLLINPKHICKYYILGLLDIELIGEIKLSQKEIENTLLALADDLTPIPTLYGINILLKGLSEPSKNIFFNPRTYTYYWQKALLAGANITWPRGSFILTINALAGPNKSEKWQHAAARISAINKTPEWQKAAADICTMAFEEICKPDCPLYEQMPSCLEICTEAYKFLSRAADNHLFEGQSSAYLNLVARLVNFAFPHLKGDAYLEKELNLMVSSLLNKEFLPPDAARTCFTQMVSSKLEKLS